jgi:hypothetical protein
MKYKLCGKSNILPQKSKLFGMYSLFVVASFILKYLWVTFTCRDMFEVFIGIITEKIQEFGRQIIYYYLIMLQGL